MMEILFIYALFATATAFTSVYELLMPVYERREAELKDRKIEYKWVMLVTFFLINILIAPVVFLSCIVPTMGIIFRDALYKGLFPKDSEF